MADEPIPRVRSGNPHAARAATEVDFPARIHTTDADKPVAAGNDPLALDQREAAKLTSLSAKTLGRLADAGEPLGRIKVGRRVLYHRATLAAWLAARAARPTGGAA